MRIPDKLLFLVALTCLAIICLGAGPPALIESDDARAPVFAAEAAAAAKVRPPTVTAISATVVDDSTGRIVYDKNAHQRLAIASMTKMMTSLVILQRGNLDKVVTVDVDASKMVGDSVMGLRPGEQLTVRQLMYGLLLPSGDDAALALARGVAGSDAAFVDLMNVQAQRLNLQDTHFVNPHGLDATGHYSTTADLITIARAVMRYPLFAEIVKTKTFTVKGKATYNLTNTNQLLTARNDIIGIKTGTTDLAGHSVTAAAERNLMGTARRLYVSVIHSDNYASDVSRLLDFFYGSYSWQTIALPPSPFYNGLAVGPGSPPVSIDQNWSEQSLFIPSWQQNIIQTDVDFTSNPDLPPGQVGVATISVADTVVARVPVVTLDPSVRGGP